MFFVHLQFMARVIVMKISAVLLLIWYSMSIIGFDIHTCCGSGRSFVATFISGLSCDEIHPDHNCDHDHCESDMDCSDACCSHANVNCTINPSSCCKDDFQVLDLTGTAANESHRQYNLLTFLYFHSELSQYVESAHIFWSGLQSSFSDYLNFKWILLEDVLSVFSIWRI